MMYVGGFFVETAELSKISSVNCGLCPFRNGISFFEILTLSPTKPTHHDYYSSLSGRFKKEEMLNKLKEIHTNYQFFVAFEEPFADTFLLEWNKLFFFNPKNQQNSKFSPIELS